MLLGDVWYIDGQSSEIYFFRVPDFFLKKIRDSKNDICFGLRLTLFDASQIIS